jgi:hypothetical protein
MEWTAMLVLGAYHGINPGMGWLFAVALGMQQGSARGVWRALPPIALGHAAAVGLVLFTAAVAGLIVPLETLKFAVAVILLTLGIYRLWRHRHPRFGGMRVSFIDLTIWSFLMASAHGAGVMVLPFVMEISPGGLGGVSAATSAHAGHMASPYPGVPWTNAMAVGVHTLAYLAVMTLAAWTAYRKLGLALLRTTWFNLDWLWAGALAATGVIVLMTS